MVKIKRDVGALGEYPRGSPSGKFAATRSEIGPAQNAPLATAGPAAGSSTYADYGETALAGWAMSRSG